MDNNKRQFVFSGLLLGIGSMFGCANIAKTQYTEKLSAIYITQDHEKIIIITDKYHYIFPANPLILSTLSGPYRSHVIASFDRFSVSDPNIVSGIFQLRIDAKADENMKAAALLEDYKAHHDGTLIAQGHLRGERYLPSNLEGAPKPEQLNREYSITVDERGMNRHKTPPSPIKSAAEGVFYIGAIPLVLVVFILGYYWETIKETFD
jgi:hypothetical protein